MTTHTYAAAMDNTTDVGFRAWGSAYCAALEAVGLVRTTDTGQVDWVTGIRNTVTNTYSNYVIYRFNDVLQSTAPIFIKIEFGSGSTIATPFMRFSVGTGSNGAGTLTGPVVGPNVMGNTSNGMSTAVATSYICGVPGFVGFAHRPGLGGVNGGTAHGPFAICRTCGPDGAPTGVGVTIYYPASGAVVARVAAIRFDAPARVVSDTPFGYQANVLAPFYAAEAINGEIPVYAHFTAMPDIQPVFGLCTTLANVVADFDTFDTAMVGTTVRRYMNFRTAGLSALYSTGAPALSLCMLWE